MSKKKFDFDVSEAQRDAATAVITHLLKRLARSTMTLSDDGNYQMKTPEQAYKDSGVKTDSLMYIAASYIPPGSGGAMTTADHMLDLMVSQGVLSRALDDTYLHRDFGIPAAEETIQLQLERLDSLTTELSRRSYIRNGMPLDIYPNFKEATISYGNGISHRSYE